MSLRPILIIVKHSIRRIIHQKYRRKRNILQNEDKKQEISQLHLSKQRFFLFFFREDVQTVPPYLKFLLIGRDQ